MEFKMWKSLTLAVLVIVIGSLVIPETEAGCCLPKIRKECHSLKLLCKDCEKAVKSVKKRSIPNCGVDAACNRIGCACKKGCRGNEPDTPESNRLGQVPSNDTATYDIDEKGLFDMFDTNHDGIITFEEAQVLGDDLTKEDFETIDTEKTGKITFEQFVNAP